MLDDEPWFSLKDLHTRLSFEFGQLSEPVGQFDCRSRCLTAKELCVLGERDA